MYDVHLNEAVKLVEGENWNWICWDENAHMKLYVKSPHILKEILNEYHNLEYSYVPLHGVCLGDCNNTIQKLNHEYTTKSVLAIYHIRVMHTEHSLR